MRNEPWADVGRFAAFSRQITSLGLQPWESTVVYADTPEAHALLRRLKAAGLSRYEPDPVAACEAAEAEATKVLADVRFNAVYGLKSDVAPCPESAKQVSVLDFTVFDCGWKATSRLVRVTAGR